MASSNTSLSLAKKCSARIEMDKSITAIVRVSGEHLHTEMLHRNNCAMAEIPGW